MSSQGFLPKIREPPLSLTSQSLRLTLAKRGLSLKKRAAGHKRKLTTPWSTYVPWLYATKLNLRPDHGLVTLS